MSNTPDSGVEAPSRFMMGLEGDEPNPDLMDDAIQKAFGIDANDVTVGNPDNVVDDAEGAAGGEGDIEPGTDANGGEDTSSTVPGDEPPVVNQGEVQGGEGEGTDVATGEGNLDFATLFESRYGRKPMPSEYDGLLQLADWANSLTPEQQAAINRALTQPASLAGGAQEQGPGLTGSPSPTPDPDPVLNQLIDQYGEDDPLVKAYTTQQSELAELRSRYQERYATEQYEATTAGIDRGTQAFRSNIDGLEDVDIDRLQGAVVNAGIFPALVQANNGNVEQATIKALEWAYWQDETFRERELNKRIAARTDVQQQHKARQTKAASVTGTGGNGASRTEAPSNKTADPWGAVAQGLREAQNNGVPG